MEEGNGIKHWPGKIRRISISSDYVGEGISGGRGGKCTPSPGLEVARVMRITRDGGLWKVTHRRGPRTTYWGGVFRAFTAARHREEGHEVRSTVNILTFSE